MSLTQTDVDDQADYDILSQKRDRCKTDCADKPLERMERFRGPPASTTFGKQAEARRYGCPHCGAVYTVFVEYAMV